MDNHLQVFITVAEKQSFSRAAEELHMTQPAVSQYIRAFENHIGTRLLERTNKFVRLNKAGEIVYHHGKEIIGLYTKMQTLVDDLQNKAHGPLSIGASYTFGEYVLPKLLAQMQAHYPNIIPRVTIGNTAKIAQLVANHKIDVGIVEGAIVEKDLFIEPFTEDEFIIAAAAHHPLTSKVEQVGNGALAKETWITRETGSGTREVTEKVFRLFDIMPKKQLEFSSTQLIKEAVESGMGLSVMSKWTIKKELKDGGIKEVYLEGLPMERTFSFIRKSPFQTKALELFVNLLRTHPY
ncbi:LysR family transcriptional regulator [Virgibacillus sp. W0430]|uniref:LysR family transcriptional regulator n=1 Tax=Virgibacillus sp. W0430 TaxID=3391580 RepID=UPI003F471C7A